MSKSAKKREPEGIYEEEFLEAAESYLGWCPDCREFTRGETEPDATGYDCDACDGNSVVGAEEALLQGLVVLIGDN